MKKNLFFKVLLFFLLLLVLEICLSLILTRLFYYEDMVYLSIDISHFIVIVLMIRLWNIDLKKIFKKIKLKNIGFLMIIGVLLTLIYPILNIPNFVNSSMSSQTGLMMPNFTFFENESFNSSKLYFLFRTLLIMPFFEEILYRGIIQNKLIEKYSVFWAITLSSLFFALGHMDFEQSIVTFFTGVIIGIIFHKTKNLTSVILLHIFINICVLFVKIEYNNSLDFKLFIYHLILIACVFFILNQVYFKSNYKSKNLNE